MSSITKAECKAFIKKAIEVGSYAFDVEHPPELSHHNPDTFRLAGCSFATAGVVHYLTNVTHIKYMCSKLFRRKDVEAIAYNAKFDIQVLRVAGCADQYPELLIDPMIAVNLLNDNRRPNELGLKVVARDLLKHEMMPFMEAWAFGEDSKEFHAYACDDGETEWRIWQELRPLLFKQKLDNVFYKILMPATKVFADIELKGVKWDWKQARKLLVGFQRLRDQMEEDIYSEIGNLNLNSGDQLAKRLFDEMGYSTRNIKMTPSGKRCSTDAKAMETLATKYPVAKKIVTYRTATKMIGTYVSPLTRMAISDHNERIHPTAWLVSTTGRTRMEKPNFQNIPAWLAEEFAGLNIRDCVIADPGYKLIVADLSQIELRLCGHISNDKKFIDAYKKWRCTKCESTGESTTILHECPNCKCEETDDILVQCPKCKIKSVPLVKARDKSVLGCRVCHSGDEYSDAKIVGFWHGEDLHTQTTNEVPALGGDRQNGKRANFALIYAATAAKMALEYPDLSKREWQEVIDGYFYLYRGVYSWHKRMDRQLHSTKTAIDIFGRKRRIPQKDIDRSPKHAFNQLVNFPVQSSACSYIQLCMVKMREHWMSTGQWEDTIYMSNFIHDEVVFECPEQMVDEFIPTIEYVMENSVQLKVPIRTSIQVVDKWSKAK